MSIEDMAMFAEDCAATGDERLLRLVSEFFALRRRAVLGRLSGRIQEALQLEDEAEAKLQEMKHEG